MSASALNIWIVNPYGALPSEGWREYRSFMLAKALAARGHKVTLWISDFVHRSKTYRTNGEIHDPLLPEGIRVIGVHSKPYRRNISWERIQYEASYGEEFARLAQAEIRPDIIVMGDPSLFFSKSILAYRQQVGCRLVLDVIDLWPELFSVALPKWLRPLSKLIFYPLYKRRSNLVRACDGVVAVSKDYLKAALKGQSDDMPNLVAYWGIDTQGYKNTPVNSELAAILQQFKSKFALTAVYAGTLGDAYDMDIIIAASERAKPFARVYCCW
jgi:Glycosyltransferase Family 4